MVNNVTQKEKDNIKDNVMAALEDCDAYTLEQLAKQSDYAMALIIDKLCEQYTTIEHIKNILK